MAKLAFRQVDVFTRVPFLGNPVAVVLGAEGLDAEAMQRIAAWTNLSETTFVLKGGAADYRLRIFTPRMELPFAGHPTIGSAHAALEAGFFPAKERFTQECGAGIVHLARRDGKIFVKAPPAKLVPVEPPKGITLKPGSPFLAVDVGPRWATGEVADANALAAVAPDMTALAEWSNALKLTGITLFAKSDDCVAAVHVRSFAPAQGIPEDPVCGSGNISVGAFLRETGGLERFGRAYVARQGAQLGRDGRVFMTVEKEEIWLGGEAVTCVAGELAP
ncbi:MAG: PhzF family phenazine biosynthesis protein [Betaproteobacteria bacterium]|nr:PhzF family phenazine biosynthesis protein [Betaproteobacteria bacterium]